MAHIKLTRTIDSEGRIRLPSAILKELDIKAGDQVYFETTKAGSLVIRKVKEKK